MENPCMINRWSMDTDKIIQAVSDTLVKAGSTFSEDKKAAYRKAIDAETHTNAKWVLKTILENAEAAAKNSSPLCDDTGIPHILLDVGPKVVLPGGIIEAIYEGVRQGLRKLPGRPMGIMGDDMQRIDQSGGLSEDPAFVAAAPIQIRQIKEACLRLHVLMLGGGPAIRGKTYRVFHRHSVQAVEDEIVAWASEAVKMLGCSPCTLAIGIGRSQYEASALMIQAQVDGRYDCQSEFERNITKRVNETNTGALGLGGDISVLGTFAKIGPQRASGVRVVCLRPACCFEPRTAYTDLTELI